MLGRYSAQILMNDVNEWQTKLEFYYCQILFYYVQISSKKFTNQHLTPIYN